MAKSRRAALAAPTNAPKILAAPVTVMVGYDLDFAEQLPKLFPVRGKDMQAYYSDPLVEQSTAFRNIVTPPGAVTSGLTKDAL